VLGEILIYFARYTIYGKIQRIGMKQFYFCLLVVYNSVLCILYIIISCKKTNTITNYTIKIKRNFYVVLE